MKLPCRFCNKIVLYYVRTGKTQKHDCAGRKMTLSQSARRLYTMVNNQIFEAGSMNDGDSAGAKRRVIFNNGSRRA